MVGARRFFSRNQRSSDARHAFATASHARRARGTGRRAAVGVGSAPKRSTIAIDWPTLCVSNSYGVDDKQRYRFANKEHKQWFGVEPEALIGRHAQHVWGDEAYSTIRPHIEAALSGSAVDCEIELAYPSGCRQIRMYLTPASGLDGTVKGFFATIEGLGNRTGAENPTQGMHLLSAQVVGGTAR